MKTKCLKAVCLLLASLAGGSAWAQVKVEGGWARATVQGQKATGAFMKLTADKSLRLVSVSSPAAGVAEIHEMKMEGNVMKMRALPVLELPAQQTVELKPGGHHLMLMDLKTPLMKDSSVSLTLTFRDASGLETRQQLSLPVTTGMPQGQMPSHASHKH